MRHLINIILVLLIFIEFNANEIHNIEIYENSTEIKINSSEKKREFTVCSSEKYSNDTLTYIFLGHIYKWGSGGNKVDPRVENINFINFDGIWLGGDVCSESSLKYETLKYIDDLFDLGNKNTHWTLGNHDVRNGNIEWITELTQRPTYYASHNNGINIIVLNGNISPLDCENIDKQYQMIKNVCDTVKSKHLILLVHHGIYKDIPGVIDPSEYGHSCLKNWVGNCNADSTDYLHTIYPLITEVEKRGIEVKHIMGDVGTNSKSYYKTSDDGIEYFGSGINNSYNTHYNIPIDELDLLLVFKYVKFTNELFWEFKMLNEF